MWPERRRCYQLIPRHGITCWVDHCVVWETRFVLRGNRGLDAPCCRSEPKVPLKRYSRVVADGEKTRRKPREIDSGLGTDRYLLHVCHDCRVVAAFLTIRSNSKVQKLPVRKGMVVTVNVLTTPTDSSLYNIVGVGWNPSMVPSILVF